MLKTKGCVGSFLVRESRSKPGNYTLSVRREKDLIHVQIFNNGDYYDIATGSEFASLTELILYYTEQANPLKEKNGNLVVAKYPLCNTDTPSSDPFFHGCLDSKLAENLLIQQGDKNGFLVRERSKVPGEFVLCVLTEEDLVKNVIVQFKNGEYFVKAACVANRFSSLAELVEHYKTKPIVEGSGEVILLGKPLVVAAASAKPHTNTKSKAPDAAPAPVKAVEKHLAEFEQLQKQECLNKSPRTEGQKPENKEKNRYKNILPFDHSRVILNDGELCDYINANYIKLPDCRLSYIATQGCLSSSVPDFWRMIWQEGSQIIVMITKLVEQGKNKCTRYWPDSPEKPFAFDLTMGRITVNFVESRLAPSKDYEIREFLLIRDVEKSDQPGEYEETGRRKIFHYNYTAWPDKSVPKHCNSLLDMLNVTSQHQSSLQRPGPIVVHCSAGIGRTGTFIVLGLIIDELQCKGVHHEVNVKQVVTDIRKQRSGMVQTELQYKFIYDTLQYYIEGVIAKQGAESEYANFEHSGS